MFQAIKQRHGRLLKYSNQTSRDEHYNVWDEKHTKCDYW